MTAGLAVIAMSVTIAYAAATCYLAAPLFSWKQIVAFPVAVGCQRCGSCEVIPVDLSRDGVVWAHTVQRFAPKSPPYVPPAEGFVPFAESLAADCMGVQEIKAQAVDLAGRLEGSFSRQAITTRATELGT